MIMVCLCAAEEAIAYNATVGKVPRKQLPISSDDDDSLDELGLNEFNVDIPDEEVSDSVVLEVSQ